MSIAGSICAQRLSGTSTTVRQFVRAVTIAGAAVGVGCLIYALETFLIHPPRRLVENPVEVMMRALGLAHFWVGWLFLFTSGQLRNRAAFTRLGALTLLGAAGCVLFSLGGGMRNPFLLVLFYGYFLVHEVRDETALYQAYGDGPERGADDRVFLTRLSWAVALLLTCVLAGGFLLQQSAYARLGRFDPVGWLAWAGFGLLLLMAVLLAVPALRLGRRVHGNLGAVVLAHRPLMCVYGGLLAILACGSLLGSVGFHLIILVHVCGWLVFVTHKLSQQPPRPVTSVWTWCRSTPAGFVTLHLVVTLVILLLMGLRIYVWERAGFVSELFARSSFAYWSLLHISMAFWRR